MKKYKLNFKKIKRNILTITFIILSIFYINYMSKYTNEKIKSCQEFTQYAKDNGAALTNDNYKTFINKK